MCVARSVWNRRRDPNISPPNARGRRRLSCASPDASPCTRSLPRSCRLLERRARPRRRGRYAGAASAGARRRLHLRKGPRAPRAALRRPRAALVGLVRSTAWRPRDVWQELFASEPCVDYRQRADRHRDTPALLWPRPRGSRCVRRATASPTPSRAPSPLALHGQVPARLQPVQPVRPYCLALGAGERAERASACHRPKQDGARVASRARPTECARGAR